MESTNYKAPTDDQIRAMPKHRRKDVWQKQKIARLGAQWRRVGYVWRIAVAIDTLPETPAIGDVIEVSVRKRGARRGDPMKIEIFKLADDPTFALPAAYGCPVPEDDDDQ